MGMVTLAVVVAVLVGVAALVAVVGLHSRLRRLSERMPDTGQIGALAGQIQHVDALSRASFERLAKDLGELSTAARQMMEVGKTVTSLENLLRPPQLRGGMGETLLAELLAQILPGHFELQHRFKSGEKVDAVIRLGGRLVPVDAKFPLESFRRLAESKDEEIARRERRGFIRTIKAHVDAIAQKYILPDEGTYDFALMYIPAENVYYETVLKDEEGEGLYPFSLQKRVIPVSPNSFYAYLQVIIHGLKGLHIEERAREIVDYLARLRADEDRFRQDFETLGTHIENARKKYEEAQRKLVRFEDKLLEAGGSAERGVEKS
jgi:DNA recombination protein RmuC